MDKTREIMRLLGVEEARLRREWISASEGNRFAAVVAEFTEEIRKLGRNPLTKRETAA